MKIADYTLEFKDVIQEILQKKYSNIALQIPEGLKRNALTIIKYLEEKTGASFIICADPCYGACDIVDYKLKDLHVDLIIQVGHTPIPNDAATIIPTRFINALSTLNVSDVVQKSLPFLEGTKIGITTTAQHLHMIALAKDILQKNNFTPIIAKGDKRVTHEGQIIGCNFSAGMKIKDKVDSFLFLGSGTFHPIGLLLSSKKPVIAADPYTNIVKKDELVEMKETILRQRYGAIASAKQAKTFGILIGLKQGQQRIHLAQQLQKMLHHMHRNAVMLALDTLTPTSLLCFGAIDCFVSTACPRIAIDDYLQYKIPILTPIELQIALGLKKWDDYIFDQIYWENE